MARPGRRATAARFCGEPLEMPDNERFQLRLMVGGAAP
jgi:hypothetical protein